MESKAKSRLLVFLFLVLVLPVAEQKINFIKSGPLKGGFKPAVDTDFSFKSWWSGRFQELKEKKLNDQTGFRPDLVRLTNQIDFSLFDKCHAGWTVKGKDQFLFQFPYINAYYGKDFVGYERVRDQSLKLKALQDTLKKLGKNLVLVYLPSKASTFPEYFPDDWKAPKIGPRNYAAYRHICDSLGVNQVDLDAWFVTMKNKSAEPLFSKQGIHWTNYGAILGGDSLTRYLEHLLNIPVQHPDWSKMEHTDKLRDGDDDIASELNLIFPEAHETMTYPIICNNNDTTKRKINAIYIGDSYAHKMIEFGVIYLMNGQCEFWRYYDEMHDINGHKFTYIKDYDWKAAIDRCDCVVISYTLFNFGQLGNGFIDQAFSRYYPQGLSYVKKA